LKVVRKKIMLYKSFTYTRTTIKFQYELSVIYFLIKITEKLKIENPYPMHFLIVRF